MRAATLTAVLGFATLSLWNLTAQEITSEGPKKILQVQLPAGPQFVAGQVIVKTKTGTSLTPEELSGLDLDTVYRRTSGDEFLYNIRPSTLSAWFERGQASDSTLAIVDVLRARLDVEYVQPNYVLRGAHSTGIVRISDIVPNDPRWAEQWHYHNNGTGTGGSPGGINLPRFWETSTGSNSVSVSVLDTGILPNHLDISGSQNLIAGFDMISDPFSANDGDGRDNDATDPGDAVAADECFPGSAAFPDSWTGTHVAGTVGVGNTNNGVGVTGVNWNVSVQAVRVLGKCGGLTSDINDAIRWAAGLSVPGVPNNTSPARVINMSLGTPPGVPCSLSPSTQSAIDDAVAAGAVVVVAAGNDAVNASQVFPASCNNVITVAASEARGHLATRYSNFGSTVEIMAPGGDRTRDDDGDGNPDGVLSMVQGGYEFYNGTSMATPHVSGVAALWLAVDPSLTPAQLLTALQSAALPRTAAQCPQPCGAGLLNAVGGPVSPTLGLHATVCFKSDAPGLRVDRFSEGRSSTLVWTNATWRVPADGEWVFRWVGTRDSIVCESPRELEGGQWLVAMCKGGTVEWTPVSPGTLCF